MSARFVTNFGVLLLGAATLVFLFADGRSVADWVALGAGVASIVLAMYSFACADQGIYQRVADLAIFLLGGWTVVAAIVMSDPGDWLVFGGGAGLVGFGAVGLVMREIALAGGFQVGSTRIGPDELAQLSSLQRTADSRR